MLTPSKIYAVKTRHPQNSGTVASIAQTAHRRPVCKDTKNSPRLTSGATVAPIRPPPYLNNRKISNPSAYAIRLNNNTIPTICEYSMNLSLGFRPLIISYQRKQRMPPIQRRNRQHIHKRQQNTEDRRQRPEALPIPFGRKNTRNTDHTPQVVLHLHFLRREQQLQIADIVDQRLILL